MKSNNYVLILAGGIGSRFWPISKSKKPKQFLDILHTGKTLLQHTYERFAQICPKENIYVITGDQYKHFVREQLPELNEEQLLPEPARKNTAPCVAYFAHKLVASNPKANMIVAPSDHVITNNAAFAQVVSQSLSIATEKDVLITLGITPTRPDTGYGYIQFDEDNGDNNGYYKVKTFSEKPTKEIAETFIQSGDFLWNAGIFIMNVKSILNALHKFLPEIDDVFREGDGLYNTDKEHAFINSAYMQCSNISLDYGVMEKAKNVCVIPSNIGWTDLGTWASLYDLYKKDYLGNAVAGTNVMVMDARNCMVMVPDNKLVVLHGLSNYIVIDSEDVLLICEKEKEQEIKQIVSDIKRIKGDKYL